MGNMMSRAKVHGMQPDTLRVAQEIAMEIYIWFFKDQKLERPIAIEQMSLALGVTERTGLALLWQEAGLSMPAERLNRIRRAYVQHLFEQENDLKRRSDRARLRRQQEELEIMECGHSSKHSPNGAGTGI